MCPWTYGENSNQGRKLETRSRRRSSVDTQVGAEGDSADADGAISSGWTDVNNWLLELATKDHCQAVEPTEQRGGLGDVDDGGSVDNLENVEEEPSQALRTRYQ